ncbi:hypothetical protein DE146DRAFT_367583 [Phaeosphaeria sp. MPI-PUGE-AT-0046c]|nr:hypothetical protein DE146DRAFT_367583 [Phaeosphaeria sp. MPI-PUGE-AT-0046c]
MHLSTVQIQVLRLVLLLLYCPPWHDARQQRSIIPRNVLSNAKCKIHHRSAPHPSSTWASGISTKYYLLNKFHALAGYISLHMALRLSTAVLTQYSDLSQGCIVIPHTQVLGHSINKSGLDQSLWPLKLMALTLCSH